MGPYVYQGTLSQKLSLFNILEYYPEYTSFYALNIMFHM